MAELSTMLIICLLHFDNNFITAMGQIHWDFWLSYFTLLLAPWTYLGPGPYITDVPKIAPTPRPLPSYPPVELPSSKSPGPILTRWIPSPGKLPRTEFPPGKFPPSERPVVKSMCLYAQALDAYRWILDIQQRHWILDALLWRLYRISLKISLKFNNIAMFCAVWYHLYNLKNVKACNFTKSILLVKLQAFSLKLYWKWPPPWVFFAFFKLH